jgi:hypothetical protein
LPCIHWSAASARKGNPNRTTVTSRSGVPPTSSSVIRSRLRYLVRKYSH